MIVGFHGHTPRDFFFVAILGRGPRAFQIGKIRAVNPLIGKFVLTKLTFTHTILPLN